MDLALEGCGLNPSTMFLVHHFTILWRPRQRKERIEDSSDQYRSTFSGSVIHIFFAQLAGECDYCNLRLKANND